ncbi:MAG: hypothetical protein RIR69_191 [Actinomycetota bacterium]|jgi:hypothetical protein
MAVCLFTVALAACGGSSSSDSSSSADEGADVDESSQIVEGNDCLTAVTAFNAVNQDVMMALGMPENFDLDKLKENIEKAKSVVPSEIETDFALFADTYGQVGELLASIADNGGITNAANAETIAEIEAKLEENTFGSALDRLQEFFLEECAP